MLREKQNRKKIRRGKGRGKGKEKREMRVTSAIIVDFVASLVFADLFAVSWGFGFGGHAGEKVRRWDLEGVKPRL